MKLGIILTIAMLMLATPVAHAEDAPKGWVLWHRAVPLNKGGLKIDWVMWPGPAWLDRRACERSGVYEWFAWAVPYLSSGSTISFVAKSANMFAIEESNGSQTVYEAKCYRQQ